MTQDEIIEKLRETMRQSSNVDVDWDSITGASTIASLGFDSLSILDLIYDIQQEFSLEFDPEDMAAIRTVEELATFLKDKAA